MTKTFIISGQHRETGWLYAVSRKGTVAAKLATSQLAAAGYIRLRVTSV